MAYPLSLGKYKLEIDAYGFVLKNPIALAVGVSKQDINDTKSELKNTQNNANQTQESINQLQSKVDELKANNQDQNAVNEYQNGVDQLQEAQNSKQNGNKEEMQDQLKKVNEVIDTEKISEEGKGQWEKFKSWLNDNISL